MVKVSCPRNWAFPPVLQCGEGSAAATFLLVLLLRPSERIGDNGHVVSRSAVVEAAQLWEKGQALWNELIKLWLLCSEQ